MTINRRQVLLSGLALAVAPFDAQISENRRRVIAAEDLLSEESAAGYRAAFGQKENIYVAIGDIVVPPWMELRVGAGASMFRELPVFAYEPQQELYVRYQWPSQTLIRHLGGIHPAQESWGEPIAFLGDQPTAWRRSYGRGVIVTLASLLGPQLLAGDREALRLADQLRG